MDPPSVSSRVPQVDRITVHLIPTSNARLQRLITIDRGQTVVIGRSSHDVSKRLSVGVDNALFDCPVVSRRHAELVWRATEEGADIAIVDAGSSHGTFVNDVRLERSKEYVLRSGDQIRLGCDINSSVGSHEGVTFNLVRVGTITDATRIHSEENTRRGFRVYGDEDSESDSIVGDDDGSSVVMGHPSSSNHTTPDSRTHSHTAKPGSQNQPIDLEEPSLSLRNVIHIDDEVEAPPAAPRLSTIDLKADSPGNATREKQYAELQSPSFPGLLSTESRASGSLNMAWDTEGYTGDWNTNHQSVVLNADSESDDQDNDDDESSSDSIEYDDILAKSIVSDVASEPYSVDEGPERMSSKKQASPELGDNNNKGHAVKSNEGSYNPPRTTHYDPVRGSQPPVSASTMLNESIPEPRYTYGPSQSASSATPCTDFGPTSRWDIGPTQDEASLFSEQPPFLFPDHNNVYRPRRIEHTPYPTDQGSALPSQYHSYPYSHMPFVDLDQPACESSLAVFGYQAGSSVTVPVPTNKLPTEAGHQGKERHTRFALDHEPVETNSTTENFVSKKRKADEMSQDEPPQPIISPAATLLQKEEPDIVVASQIITPNLNPTTVSDHHTTVIVHAEQPRAKRARTAVDVAQSIVKTAGRVIGYTALGGVATAYFLQSPAAEALCQWL